MKKLFFVAACLWVLAAPLHAVAGPPTIVVVRIYDSGASITAVITRGEGKNEKIEFNSGVSDKKLTQASEGYYKFLERLYQEGYSLQSTINNGNTGLITLLFVKNQ